jgi:hypothetical protein
MRLACIDAVGECIVVACFFINVEGLETGKNQPIF